MGATKERDRSAAFSTTTRIRLLGEQTAARVYRSQSRRQARRSRLTGRAALLALVVCSLIVALAYPIRQYVAQRADIAEQERILEEERAETERLRDEKARWQDPAYVERQARERLHMVRPGERGYTVVDPSAARERRPQSKAAADRAWYVNLFDGVDTMDRAGRGD
ncbi:septum formation initiator family protein [Streptomyces sp. TRM66268-LWL]|uniref:Septum formation initiator family protein n=1 Tax=Streptomyces polyasparticus TaxID=2767826 RepID=A0ABR7SPA4_9ACTN|nr:septum formation initiator family protein [Streptomyces polyasparticus]MBC9716744.1 septum formation initiator family protein [Streptomyces polyasparticus]